MSRLIQGDVGSGKTVVAMCAMADVAAAGGQSALMAPTEILARQHYETISGPLTEHGVGVILLTGRDKGAGRAEKLRALASGAVKVAVGTHALFQDDVVFDRLKLAVVDEQHRFGVAERQRLQTKGRAVHLLAMSATPIPRTLELTLYGDLDVSRIDEKPPGRTPVATRAAPMTRIGEVEARLREAVKGGAQAFWICPLVSESELIDLKAAETRAAELKETIGPSVGLIHGKMAPAAKDIMMAEFADEDPLSGAEGRHHGGRGGRQCAQRHHHGDRTRPSNSAWPSATSTSGPRRRMVTSRSSSCVLLYDPPLSETAQKRLDTLRRTDDNFLIAETDLEQRGSGDATGLKQSGFPDYVFADVAGPHRDLIAAAGDDAKLIVNRDPDLKSERGKAPAGPSGTVRLEGRAWLERRGPGRPRCASRDARQRPERRRGPGRRPPGPRRREVELALRRCSVQDPDGFRDADLGERPAARHLRTAPRPCRPEGRPLPPPGPWRWPRPRAWSAPAPCSSGGRLQDQD